MEAVKEIDIGQPPDEIPPYEETPLISSDYVFGIGVAQNIVLCWSRSSDLDLFGRRSSDRHGDLKIPARGRCDLKIARSDTVNQVVLNL